MSELEAYSLDHDIIRLKRRCNFEGRAVRKLDTSNVSHTDEILLHGF